MSPPRLIAIAALAALIGSALLGGGAPLGRVLLSLGLPALAAPLLQDPAWKGVAFYRVGAFAQAAGEFRTSGDMLNLGNAEAHAAQYARALEAFDTARMAGDPDADANFDLLAAFYAGLALDPEAPIAWFSEKDGGEGAVVKSSIAQGGARAAGAGDETTNTGALLGLPELASHGRRAVRKQFDDKFMVANTRWLATLPDVPGKYLAARIRHERKRRARLGLAQPEPEDPR
ncbi:hypothetical protein [Microbulbifer sp. S227A]|uniref:hypothetical protein n=1 Tax=Microbulbifer sp. S227A TaxID=3415131 RepID=UPI003C7D5BA5